MHLKKINFLSSLFSFMISLFFNILFNYFLHFQIWKKSKKNCENKKGWFETKKRKNLDPRKLMESNQKKKKQDLTGSKFFGIFLISIEFKRSPLRLMDTLFPNILAIKRDFFIGFSFFPRIFNPIKMSEKQTQKKTGRRKIKKIWALFQVSLSLLSPPLNFS